MSKQMTLSARQEMLMSIKKQYSEADWKQKNQLLNAFIAATNCERKHAIKLLNGKSMIPLNQQKERGKKPNV